MFLKSAVNNFDLLKYNQLHKIYEWLNHRAEAKNFTLTEIGKSSRLKIILKMISRFNDFFVNSVRLV